MIRLATALAPHVLRGLAVTLRTTTVGDEHLAAVRGGPFLFVMWHGRILVPILCHRDQGIVAMVSLSRDGELTTRVLHGLGYRSVRGSSSRGGGRAYHDMLGALAGGAAGAIISDGPRGPREVLKPGVLYLAQEAQVPILPLAAAARPAIRFSSWDRFVLPLPGSRGFVVYGPPLTVAPGLSSERIDRLRADLERRLIELQARADAVAAGEAETTTGAAARTGPT